MRLIRLKVRNIASLKGEHEIDFTEISKCSPLFAITGETGSGKSSVLNSIGLALYGEIYKKNINQVDVVTLGEKDGSIDLIFQVKGHYYLADWKARVLKQNGEPYSTPQSPIRNLYKIEGPEFSAPKNIASVTTTELLNLDFEQFCRCIILNQGEFAKFLNSSFKDRRDILEKLYPGEVLDNISKELDAERKALEKSKQEIDIQLETLKGTDVSGEDLKNEKKKLEVELIKSEETSKIIDELHSHFISLYAYHEKYNANEKNKENIRSTMAIETTKFNLILKSGEIIQERFQTAKKAQETELPLLETFLKKEETLKHLEEGWLNHKKKAEELRISIDALSEKLDQKSNEEKSQKEKLNQLVSLFNLPIIQLRALSDHFDPLFEVFSEHELINEELKGKREKLLQLETTGKELKALTDDLDAKISLIPVDLKEQEKKLENKKAELSAQIEKKQRAEIKSQELSLQITQLKIQQQEFESKSQALAQLNGELASELLPIETTLKLQEIFTAKEVCVDHALKTNESSCPVCEQNVSNDLWKTLKARLAETNISSLKLRFDDLAKKLQKSLNNLDLTKLKLSESGTLLAQKEKEHVALVSDREAQLPTLSDIDLELNKLREQIWDLNNLTKESTVRKAELQKTRELYLKQKTDTAHLEKAFADKTLKLSELSHSIKELVPSVNKDSIRDLKQETRYLRSYLEAETTLEKIQQDLKHTTEKKTETVKAAQNYAAEEDAQLKKVTALKSELREALNGEKASDLIQKINQVARQAGDEWTRHVEEEKKQQSVLKESQGRLNQLDELTKDFDLLFTKELFSVKEISKTVQIEELSPLHHLDFDFTTPKELFIPLQDLLQEKKKSYKKEANDLRMKFSAVVTRLSEWEKLQDKISLLELKAKDLNESLSRKMRLYEVLGKDELRTFVLSLVEENLIQQTNEELQKLCQGRYEIVHQTKSMKMTPEFFILDKFREGGRRKVSTLSGGETFMVSLAMALGLAEMTRGQAEIDSLFIDEGFGTLDQDSLEDVLDMLQQIQNRGLMVGIISHIKSLTNALPVNLILHKKQDGTSDVSIQFN